MISSSIVKRQTKVKWVTESQEQHKLRLIPSSKNLTKVQGIPSPRRAITKSSLGSNENLVDVNGNYKPLVRLVQR